MERVIADHGYSERRACRLIGVDRSSFQYERKGGGDGSVRARLRELANERRRFGYRRLAIMLGREGMRMNLKKIYRLYREERLMVRRRGGRKRALGTRAPMAIPQEPNQRWSLDFVSDALNDGRRFRVLAVVDDFTRECLATVVDTSLSGQRVVRELGAIIARRGKPCMIMSDNGTELVSRAILRFTEDTGIEWHYIAPGKPVRDKPSSRASTAGCAMNASTSTPSPRSPRPEGSSKPGGSTTTPSGPIRASAASHRRCSQAGPLRTKT